MVTANVGEPRSGRSTTEVLLRGAIAGAAASVPQAVVGKLEDILFLPDEEDANIAPRLVDRLARKAGKKPNEEEKWILGTLFHVGYGAGWGATYALAAERFRPPPLIGGALLGSLIYGITFPRWGGAVLTGTERPPGRRTARMTAVAVSVAMSFGLATGLIYHSISGSEAAPDE